MPRIEKTKCSKGHEMTGDNVKLRTKDGYTFRHCVACKNASNRAWRQNNPELYKRIQYAGVKRARKAGKIRCGFTKNVINTVTKEQVSLAIEAVRETGKIVSATQFIDGDRFHALRFFIPKLGAMVNRIVTTKRPPLRLIAKPAIRFTRKMSPEDLMVIVNKAVPRHLMRDQRDDIIGRMLLDLMEGRLRVEDVDARVRVYISADFRDNHNKYGAMSLDMKLGDGDGDFSMIDMIPDTQRLWA